MSRASPPRAETRAEDGGARERVMKRVGVTSAAFIGPTLPPQTIEETLSEFYRELDALDPPANGTDPGTRPHTPPPTCAAKRSPDVTAENRSPDGSRTSRGRNQPPWPHWYQNEPYQLRRPGPDQSSGRSGSAHGQWPPPPPPPLRHPAPPPAFPHPQNPPHLNPTWTGSAQNQDKWRCPTFPSFASSNVYGSPTQGRSGSDPHPVDGDGGDWMWTRDGDRSQFGPDRRRRPASESEFWEQRHHCRPPDAPGSSPVLILMRGLPGSGKSTLARELVSSGPSGLILSTDDYFAHQDGYRYEPDLLGAAHEWNQSRADAAMLAGRSPVIIDNTNVQAWEMKPYVRMALDRGYRVDFCEPDTSWKSDPCELERRNRHGVPREKIAAMLDRFSSPVSVDVVMSSREPPHVSRRRRAERTDFL